MPASMGLYSNADTTFLEGFAIPYKPDQSSALDYEDVVQAFCMIQAALQAKTAVTEKLQDENYRLQQQVELLQNELSQATVAELDCGSLREEIERLMQVKSEISQERAEVLRANQFLRQERDLACEQLEDIDSETRLCAACEERISMAEKVQQLEKQVSNMADENTRLRQQLQHFREFYKKSKQNWQSEQALLLQVIQLQSKTCDHLMQPSRTSSALSTPKTLSTPTTPKLTVSSRTDEGTPSISPCTSTPITTPVAVPPHPERTPVKPIPPTPASPSNDHPTRSSITTPPSTTTPHVMHEHLESAPSTSSSARSVHTQLLSPPPTASPSSVSKTTACAPSSSNVVHKPLRHVQVSNSSPQTSQQTSPNPVQDVSSNSSPGLQDYANPAGSLSSPPSLGNRLMQRQPSDVGWRMPKVVSTFGLGAAIDASKGDATVKGSKVASIIRSLSTTEQSVPLKTSPPSKKPAPRIVNAINSITSPRGDDLPGAAGGAPVRHESAPALMMADASSGESAEPVQQAWNAKRVSSVSTTC